MTNGTRGVRMLDPLLMGPSPGPVARRSHEHSAKGNLYTYLNPSHTNELPAQSIQVMIPLRISYHQIVETVPICWPLCRPHGLNHTCRKLLDCKPFSFLFSPSLKILNFFLQDEEELEKFDNHPSKPASQILSGSKHFTS